MEDSLRHKGLRKNMVNSLRQKNIRHEGVLRAMSAIPRHLFMDEGVEDISYEDRAFPISSGQTISQPYTVAFQSQLLDISPGDKVLEIGTGSGYQACILAYMGACVYSIERHEALYLQFLGNKKLKRLLSSLKDLHCFWGDGYQGLADHAPFHKILITAAADAVPPKLLRQLEIGGMMVLPIGNSQSTQTMTRIIKQNAHSYKEEKFSQFQFVPMLEGRN